MQRVISNQAANRVARKPLWTRSYVLLCLSMGLAYVHEGLLVPTIPLYVQSLTGSAAIVGLVLGLFSLLGFTIRPFLGQLADRANPRFVFVLGTLCLSVCDVAFLVPVFGLICLVSAVRGAGWAGVNTGGNTILAYLAPAKRRAEGATYYSLFQGTAMALTPIAALWIIKSSGGSVYWPVFLAAAGCGVAAALLSQAILAHLLRPKGSPSAPARPERRDRWSLLYDRGVVLPAGLLALMNLTFPAATSFMPLYFERSGIDLGMLSWYYVARAAGVVITQSFLARTFDRIGRGRATALGLGLSIAGLGFLLAPGSVVLLTLGGIATAVGQSIGIVNTTAMAIDRSNPQRLGSAMASFTLAFQVGQGAGAALAGGLIQAAGYRAMFLTMIGSQVVCLALLAARWSTPATQPQPTMDAS